MFSEASNFNQPLNAWDVSSVTNMRCMFDGASNFNQPLNEWDVSSVTDMTRMFDGASNFDHSINDWDLPNEVELSDLVYRERNSNKNFDLLKLLSSVDKLETFHDNPVISTPKITGTLGDIASAINFLLIINGSAVLRYTN